MKWYCQFWHFIQQCSCLAMTSWTTSSSATHMEGSWTLLCHYGKPLGDAELDIMPFRGSQSDPSSKIPQIWIAMQWLALLVDAPLMFLIFLLCILNPNDVIRWLLKHPVLISLVLLIGHIPFSIFFLILEPFFKHILELFSNLFQAPPSDLF